MADDLRVLIAVCHNAPMVFVETAKSLVEVCFGNRVDEAKAQHGIAQIGFSWEQSWPRVDAMRDAAMSQARAAGFSHVLFLDADMAWPTDLLPRFLRHVHEPNAIVGGLYVLKGAPYAPVAMGGRFTPEGSQVEQFYHLGEYGTELLEADVVGMGCTLVPVAVLEALGPRPWFEYRNDDEGWPRVTEDVAFCVKAKDAGWRVLFDPTMKCIHYGLEGKDERHHRRYQASMAHANQQVTIRPLEPAEVSA